MHDIITSILSHPRNPSIDVKRLWEEYESNLVTANAHLCKKYEILNSQRRL